MYIYVFMYRCFYVNLFLCLNVYMYLCKYVYMYTCVHVYIHLHIYIYTCIYTYIYIFTHIYMYIYGYKCICFGFDIDVLNLKESHKRATPFGDDLVQVLKRVDTINLIELGDVISRSP